MNLKERFARMKELQAQKKKIYDEVDKITKSLGALKAEQEALSKKIDPKVQSAADINKTLIGIIKGYPSKLLFKRKKSFIALRPKLSLIKYRLLS